MESWIASYTHYRQIQISSVNPLFKTFSDRKVWIFQRIPTTTESLSIQMSKSILLEVGSILSHVEFDDSQK